MLVYYLSRITKGEFLMKTIIALRMVFLMAVLALLSACASGPKSFMIKGEGDPVLNRDINGKSLSVVVRIYQLKDAREFSKLTFDMLASGRPESELLGPALLDKTDVVVVPGGEYVSTEKLLDETRFVGIVAFFRSPDAYYWRQLVDAESINRQSGVANRASALTFRVQDCYIALTGTKPVPLPGQPQNARPECAALDSQTTPPNTRPAPALPPTSNKAMLPGNANRSR